MTVLEQSEWKKDYVPGKSTLYIRIPSNCVWSVSTGKFYTDYGEKLDKRRGIKHWIKSIDELRILASADLQNAESCVEYIQAKYPHASIQPTYHGLEIDGLTDSEIFICAGEEKLIFDVWLDNNNAK